MPTDPLDAAIEEAVAAASWTGRRGARVWMACECGAVILRPSLPPQNDEQRGDP